MDQAGKALVQSVIDVTKALGKYSIAEGVEDYDKSIALAEMGCDSIQGYLFAKPMPPTDAAHTLEYLRSYQLAVTSENTLV